jgi:hypothetical protein
VCRAWPLPPPARGEGHGRGHCDEWLWCGRNGFDVAVVIGGGPCSKGRDRGFSFTCPKEEPLSRPDASDVVDPLISGCCHGAAIGRDAPGRAGLPERSAWPDGVAHAPGL